MDGFDSMLEQELTAGDAAEATPQTGSVSETTETGVETTAPTPTLTPAPAEDELPASVRDYLAQNPDHKSIVDLVNRELKGAFTPRLQEAAELRRQLEGLDPDTLATIRQVQELAQTDPAAVADWFRRNAEEMEARLTTPEPEPLGFTPETDREEALWREVQALKNWQQQQQEQVEQQQLQVEAQRVHAECNKIEQEFGVQLPIEARNEIWSFARQKGLGIEDAYFLKNRTTLMQSVAQKARDEASKVVSQKQALGGAGVPAGVPNRVPSTTEIPRDFDGMVRHFLEEFGE